MKKILGIVRASTEKQETDSQKKELIQFLNGYGFRDEEIEIIEVAGASARKKNDKYLQMLEDIKRIILNSPTIDSVGLWSLDRLGRVDDSLVEMKNWFEKNKVQVYCKSPSFTLFNDEGRVSDSADITFNVFAAIIKTQTQDIFNKFSRGKARNSKNMKFNGGFIIKFGYKLDENNYIVPNYDKTLPNDMSEAELVKLFFKMYSSGEWSVNKLCAELDARGYKQREGREIKHQFVNNILSDTSYIGYSDKKNSHRKYEPIIDEAIFQTVQNIKKGSQKLSTNATKNFFLGTKLITCPYCGYHYRSANRQYQCTTHLEDNRTHQKNCTESKSISVKVMDTLIWRHTVMEHIGYLKFLDKEGVKEYENEIRIVDSTISELNKKLEKNEIKKKRAVITWNDGDFTDAEYRERMAKIKSEKQVIQNEIKNKEERRKELENQIESIKNGDTLGVFSKMALEALDETNYEIRRKLVIQHISGIGVRNTEHEGRKKQLINIVTKRGAVFTYLYDSTYNNLDKSKMLLVWNPYKDSWESDKPLEEETIRKLLAEVE